MVGILSQCPVSLLMEEHLRPEFEGLSVQFVPLEEEGLSVDFIIAIGGDGTIIGSSRYATAFHAPILGVNVGRLGFLASVEPGQLSLLKRCLLYTSRQLPELAHSVLGEYAGKIVGEMCIRDRARYWWWRRQPMWVPARQRG